MKATRENIQRMESVLTVLALALCMLFTLVACSDHDDEDGQEVPTVNTVLTFSLPQTIVAAEKSDDEAATTRMKPDVVQKGEDVASFRGLDDIRILCFNGYPTATGRKRGNILYLPAMKVSDLTQPGLSNYKLYTDVQVPMGTTHFAFYARAIDAQSGQPSYTHEERRHYGILEPDMPGGNDVANDDIRFRPVQICTSPEQLGGSNKGQALLHLLNDLLNITGPEAAPDDRWATATHTALRESYQALTALKTSSSFNVETMLTSIYKTLQTVSADEPGSKLAALIIQTIEDRCAALPDEHHDRLTLIDEYQGFPADLNLPSGMARIIWDATQSRFDFPNVREYGKGFDIPSPDDYVYPASLYYHVISDIVASDEEEAPDYEAYTSWNDIINNVYAGAPKEVRETSRSVGMVKQLQYAVGRIDARVMMEELTLYDAYGRPVDVSKGFTLKGYLVGGQHEVDYDFKPVSNTPEYAIYDTDLAAGQESVKPYRWTNYNHILGLETPSDQNVYIALELVNDGDDFQGADGRIVHGATFYLVANMIPSTGENYDATNLNQIFRKDYVTKVNLGILRGWPDKDGDNVPDPDLDDEGHPKPLTGLATATYGLPNMLIDDTPPSFGLSVNLTWQLGIVYIDVPL